MMVSLAHTHARTKLSARTGHMHARINTRTHSQTHTHTPHRDTHIDNQATRTHMFSPTYRHVQTSARTRTHVYTHRHTYARKHMHTNTHLRTHRHTHTQRETVSHTRTHTHTHTHIAQTHTTRRKFSLNHYFTMAARGEYCHRIPTLLTHTHTHTHTPLPHPPTHVHTYSMYSQQILCDILIPEIHFFLIEEIKNIAERLTSHFKFIIHWIPSHIEKTSIGPGPIIGNALADTLANSAQQLATSLDTANNITDIRHKILCKTASLISNIDTLLSFNPHPRLRTTSDLLMPYGISLSPETSRDT